MDIEMSLHDLLDRIFRTRLIYGHSNIRIYSNNAIIFMTNGSKDQMDSQVPYDIKSWLGIDIIPLWVQAYSRGLGYDILINNIDDQSNMNSILQVTLIPYVIYIHHDGKEAKYLPKYYTENIIYRSENTDWSILPGGSKLNNIKWSIPSKEERNKFPYIRHSIDDINSLSDEVIKLNIV